MAKINASVPCRGIVAKCELGNGDRQIFAITLFVALRLAFSTVNDALGATPDSQLTERVPTAVRSAVTFGRPPAPSRLRVG